MLTGLRTEQYTRSDTYFGFHHLVDVFLQSDFHSSELSRDGVIQLTRHWLQTLSDG